MWESSWLVADRGRKVSGPTSTFTLVCRECPKGVVQDQGPGQKSSPMFGYDRWQSLLRVPHQRTVVAERLVLA